MESEQHIHTLFAASMKSLQEEIHTTAKNSGFYDGISRLKGSTSEFYPDNKKELDDMFVIKQLGLVVSEIAEAMEYRRAGDANDDKLTHHKGVAVEMADAIIRCLDLSEYLGYDLGSIITEKMAFNKNRPRLHGKTC